MVSVSNAIFSHNSSSWQASATGMRHTSEDQVTVRLLDLGPPAALLLHPGETLFVVAVPLRCLGRNGVGLFLKCSWKSPRQ